MPVSKVPVPAASQFQKDAEKNFSSAEIKVLISAHLYSTIYTSKLLMVMKRARFRIQFYSSLTERFAKTWSGTEKVRDSGFLGVLFGQTLREGQPIVIVGV